MTTTRATLALTAALCAALAGCGTDSETSSGTTPTATPTAAVSTGPSAGTATSDAEDSGDSENSENTESSEAAQGSDTSENTDGRDEPSADGSEGSDDEAAPTQTARAKSDNSRSSGTRVAQRDVGDYGDAAVNAWQAGDREALSKYVDPSVKTDVSSASAPSGDLTRVACEGDMCSYITEDERRVTLTFDRDRVEAGRSGGITAIKVD